MQRELLIGFGRGGDQFRQSGGPQQAARNARGKGRARERHDGKTDPKRIAAGRVGRIGRGVEKQIAQTLPRQMFNSFQMEADPAISAVSSLLLAAVLIGIGARFAAGRMRRSRLSPALQTRRGPR